MGPDTNGKEAVSASFLLTRAVTALVRLCGLISTVLIIVMLAIVAYAITQRYIFDTPLLWGDELNGYLLVATIMLGAAEALRRGDHIAIDLVSARLSPGLARAQIALANLSIMAFATIVGLSIWDSISFARSFGSYSVGYIEIETWIPQVPVVIGMVLVFLTAALGLYRSVRGLPQ